MRDTAEAVRAILIEELSDVTPGMIDAGSAAALAISTRIDARGRRQPSSASTAEELTAVWRAMLAVALGVA